MDLWNREIMKPLLVPGGILFLAALLLLQGGAVSLPPPVIQSSYYAIFLLSALLAWRFHSSRVLLALLTLFLANQAVEFFSGGMPARASGHIAVEAVALLLPVNFLACSLGRERGFAMAGIAPKAALLFFESVFVAVLCRPGADGAPGFLHPALIGSETVHAGIPQLGWLAFITALMILLARFFLYRKPVEAGLFWALLTALLGLEVNSSRVAEGYAATAALILAGTIIENSYALAFHDELTGLPARRAFNEDVQSLPDISTVAMVDIDHFKKFNDTYGHETGDHVLRMVASRLARAGGGGKAYRVGGEEFTILFAGVSLRDALPYLELLRSEVESASFRVRIGEERRRASPAGPDRRRPVRQRKLARRVHRAVSPEEADLSVTVSMGAAEFSRASQIDRVIQTADKALYRAKRSGRNRVESGPPARTRRSRESVA